MTTTRYFEVKVTGCKDCMYARIVRNGCGICSQIITAKIDDNEIYKQNHNQLTPSCPRWNETKESETK